MGPFPRGLRSDLFVTYSSPVTSVEEIVEGRRQQRDNPIPGYTCSVSDIDGFRTRGTGGIGGFGGRLRQRTSQVPI